MPTPLSNLNALSEIELKLIANGITNLLVDAAEWDASTLDDVSSVLSEFGLIDLCDGLPSEKERTDLATCGQVKRTDRPVCPHCLRRAESDLAFARGDTDAAAHA